MPPKTRATTQDTLFKQLLVTYTLTVASLHWAISAYTTHASAAPQGSALRAAGLRAAGLRAAGAARVLERHLRVDGGWSGARGGHSDVCVERIAGYYAPQWTEPRLEDFEFLVHASRAWKDTAHTALLIVFTDTGARTQLARTCRAHAECRHLSAPPFRHNRTTAAYTEFVQVLLGSLQLASCGVPAAGILIYAPAVGQRGASLDSRLLLQHSRRNTTTCLDANPSPCMIFAW